MKKILILLVLGTLCFAQSAYSWGRAGHEAIAKIAEENLTPRAKRTIEAYLGGHSIVYFAKWMDDVRNTPAYHFSDTWHTAPVDAECNYDQANVKPEKGSAIYGLELAIENLKDYRHKDDSTVAVNIKYILHLVGDMHCPAHIKYAGINMKYDVKLNGQKYYVHHVWDTHVIAQTRIWSSTEWAFQLDRMTRAQKREIAAGTPRDWLHDAAEYCRIQFEIAPPDATLSQDFLNAATPIVEREILYAGYRMAALLNQIFG